MTVTKPARALCACAATLSLAAGVAACGGSSDDESAVKSRVQTTFSGFGDKDSGKICDSLSSSYKKKITSQSVGKSKPTCEKLIGRVLTLLNGSALKQVGDTKVGAVSVDGDKATAEVSYKGGKKSKVALVKEGDAWRVDDFSLQKR